MKKKYYIAGLTLLALLTMLFSTDPARISSVGLVVPFILLFVFLANLFMIYLGRGNLSKSQQRRLAGLLAGFPCMLLVLQSVDQLSVRDAAILVGFFGISCFYVTRAPRPATHS